MSVLEQLLWGLLPVERELLLFASFWFIVGAIDEMAIDFSWLWLRLTGRAREAQLSAGHEVLPLSGRAAVLVPAWRETEVIGAMIRHTLGVWPHDGLTLYVGCYCNDAETLAAAMEAADEDGRVRLVIHGRHGPTTKADCLNRLYAALCDDEARSGIPFTSVVLHDAEDMVHPAALSVIDGALGDVNFVQLPVRPEPQPDSHMVAGHYSDEFTEAHAKSLVVRDALGAGIPAAGVGCGFSRVALGKLAEERMMPGEFGPFAADCLTEDYELGLLVSGDGSMGRFLRLRDSAGGLVATRAFFPGTLDSCVRQKTRWIHGIALQGWDRLGWSGRPIDIWMAFRDRRGPLTALVLAAAYGLIVIEGLLAVARLLGWMRPTMLSPALHWMLSICFVSFLWRASWRFGFTAREYGYAEALRSILRIPVANIVAIMSGRRAMVAYLHSLRGAEVVWDKTTHHFHPAMAKGCKRA